MYRFFNHLPLTLLLLVCLISCKKDDTTSSSTQEDTIITITPTTLTEEYIGGYKQVEIVCDKSCNISCEESWIELTTSSLESGGVLEFYLDNNLTGISRTGVIKVSLNDDSSIQSILTVTQSGYFDGASNSLAADSLTKDFRVGWGYNIFEEYQSINAVTEVVIDYNKLVAAESILNYPIIQEDNRSISSVSVLSGYTLYELSESFTYSTTSSAGFMGCSKTTAKYIESSSYSLDERSFGYGRFSKVVASRYLDQATLQYIIDNSDIDILSSKFTDALRHLEKDNSDNEVIEFIQIWGTHLVVSADLGGMIEYFMDFEKSKISDLQSFSEVSSSTMFGIKTSSSSSSSTTSSFSDYYKPSSSLKITAGDPSIISDLESKIASFSSSSTLDQSSIAAWTASLEGDYTTDLKLQSYLSVVACNTIPIWDVIANETLKERVKVVAYALADENPIYVPTGSGVGNSKITLDSNWTKFSDSGTQVKVVYNSSKTPILEICHEYVPDIRTDKRVVVVYPISNGKANIAQGIFLGDGDGNQPSYVSFASDMVYIQPISNLEPNAIVTEVYNVQGSLYLTDLEIDIVSSSGNSCSDAYCSITYYAGTENIPIIKIGGGYWTREYTKSLSFYDSSDQECSITDSSTGICYMYHFGIMDEGFEDSNEDYLGVGLWALPTTAQVYFLKDYLYKNPKALFSGQVSGFDLQHYGFYGVYNPHTGEDYSDSKYLYRDKGVGSYVACKDSAISGSVLSVNSDYTITVLDDNADTDNYYPVRLFRGTDFQYK